MDTRTKIISFDAALELARDRQVRWVTGHFDPLLADDARRVHQVILPGHALIAVVTNSPDPLLPQRARAELVAALADVDYVVMRNGPPGADSPEDAGIAQAFIQHVAKRQRGELA